MTRQDLKWGMKIGLGAGLAFAVLGWVAGGGSLSGTTSYGVPVRPAIFAFLVDGPIAGLVLGSLRPLLRSPWGSAVISVLIGTPFNVLFCTFSGTLPRSPLDWLVLVIIPSVGVWGGGAAGAWFITSRRVKARKRRSQENHHHKGRQQKGDQQRR